MMGDICPQTLGSGNPSVCIGERCKAWAVTIVCEDFDKCYGPNQKAYGRHRMRCQDAYGTSRCNRPAHCRIIEGS
jgi:hypothetical protein